MIATRPLLSVALAWCGVAAVLLPVRLAHADLGEVAVGSALGFEVGHATGQGTGSGKAGVAGVTGALGLTDSLALRLSLAGRMDDERHLSLRGLLGLSVAWDVLALVPEVVASVGGEARRGQAPLLVAQGGLGLRGYCNFDWSWEVVLGGGIRGHTPAAALTLALWRRVR